MDGTDFDEFGQNPARDRVLPGARSRSIETCVKRLQTALDQLQRRDEAYWRQCRVVGSRLRELKKRFSATQDFGRQLKAYGIKLNSRRRAALIWLSTLDWKTVDLLLRRFPRCRLPESLRDAHTRMTKQAAAPTPDVRDSQDAAVLSSADPDGETGPAVTSLESAAAMPTVRGVIAILNEAIDECDWANVRTACADLKTCCETGLPHPLEVGGVRRSGSERNIDVGFPGWRSPTGESHAMRPQEPRRVRAGPSARPTDRTR